MIISPTISAAYTSLLLRQSWDPIHLRYAQDAKLLKFAHLNRLA